MVGWVDGDKIAGLRNQQGLGLRELATKAQVDHSVISRLERNLQEDCMVSVVVAIASALGVAVDDLLRDGQQATNRKLIPEFQAVSNDFAQHPPKIQRQAAGILRGFLSTLDEV